ncbi:hypothetical protein AXF42_Ash013659 [Apostasia shenzhenica]|uniref:Uncharacterized protein n=1 Tax=Apostasia shenzhenica TaxID=1088818 RepID=A0A2I0API5_9ASPA|nr:hypothetical protein AXF42_Ash013659 [Apostasia shenzhenica]
MLANHGRHPDFAAGSYFSFSGPSADHLEYDAWAENIKSTGDSFGRRCPDRKFGPWARRISRASAGGDEEDAPSPPLWKSLSAEPRPNQSVITKYRQEMMELIRGAPETAYELSLRDIVELPSAARGGMSPEKEEKVAVLTEVKKEKRKGRRRLRSSSRKESMAGFLLKIFTPAVIDSRRKCSRDSAAAKVSPKPMAAAADKDWSNSEFGERSSSNGSSDSSGICRSRSRWYFSFRFRSRDSN